MDTQDIYSLEHRSQLHGIKAIGKEHAWTVGSYGILMTTHDGGKNWDMVEVGEDIHLRSIYAVDENMVWAGGSKGLLFLSRDGGKVWDTQTLDIDYDISSLAAVNESVLWAALNHKENYRGGKILKSMDGGSKWEEQDLGRKMIFYEIHTLNDMTAWVLGTTADMPRSTLILRTEDGGASWELRNEANGGIGSLTVASKTVLWAAGHIGRYCDVYHPLLVRFTAGGKAGHSQKITGADTFMHELTSIHAVSTKVAWVVGEYGLFARTVNGKDWVGGEMGSGTMNLGSVCAIDQYTAWAVGNNPKSVWRTTNGGASWCDLYPFYY